jgi:hypothetical protein
VHSTRGRSKDDLPIRTRHVRGPLEELPREQPGLIALELLTQVFRLMVGHDREDRALAQVREPLEDEWVALRLRDLSHIKLFIAHTTSL